MPNIRGGAETLYWAVVADNHVAASGIMEPGGITGTGDDKALISHANANDYLGELVGKGSIYNELPDSGWLMAGDMYSYEGDIVIVRQSHSRTEWPPSDTPALFMTYQEGAGVLDWMIGEQVYVGTIRMYDDIEYVCLQQHVTQSDWRPPLTLGVLWQLSVAPSPDWQVGVYYAVGTHVLYGGQEWVCAQAHTSIITWYPGAPGVYLWTVV